MSRPKRDANAKPTRRRPPAKTLESEENQLVSLAMKLAAKQLADGTATSQVETHFLQIGTVKAQLELEKLRRENALLKAKEEALKSLKDVEKLYTDAIKAMRLYSGSDKPEYQPGEDYEDD